MIIERLLLLAGITLSILVFLALIKQRQFKDAQSAANNRQQSTVHNAKVQLIYFWSTQCNQCKTVQTPIIDNMTQTIGEDKLTVKRFNASESPAQAKTWGVKTVPTVYILDKDSNVQHVNNGLVTEKTLITQIKNLEDIPKECQTVQSNQNG